jgi:anti-sigma regulatory factor (Ser/Thr protein kinase)
MRALVSGTTQWICPHSRMTGFLRTAPMLPQDETNWIRFGLATQQAATTAGFPRKVAAQLAAALGEFNSNVYEHSNASGTGIIAFHARPGRFEFVVSDRGIGVLRSLRSGPDYPNLTDHGEALRLTLTDGVSRFGANSGRGRGLRPLFIGLANLNGALRFRSGDHALLIDGRGPSLMTARPTQKAPLQGFLVSVSCETDAPHRNH